jgi:hypothetical protein
MTEPDKTLPSGRACPERDRVKPTGSGGPPGPYEAQRNSGRPSLVVGRPPAVGQSLRGFAIVASSKKDTNGRHDS